MYTPRGEGLPKGDTRASMRGRERGRAGGRAEEEPLKLQVGRGQTTERAGLEAKREISWKDGRVPLPDLQRQRGYCEEGLEKFCAEIHLIVLIFYNIVSGKLYNTYCTR